jgi:mono/diheme cytochrome c family protein
MASAVARYPSEGAAYCTYCHNPINGLQPQRPDIPKKAKTVLEALGRANYMSTWVNDLLKEAQQKKLSVTVEEEDIRLLKMLLQEAKAGWHSFNFEGAETKANKAYEEGLDIKERLSRKLGLK